MNASSGWRLLTGWLPGLRLLSSYDRSCLGADLTAGLVVALVTIPSAIAYADLAKCPPVAGPYAALGGMIVFALFTSSRHVIVGPDAAFAILGGASVGPLSAGDPGQAVVLSTWLALLAAFILLLAGWLKLGKVMEFLSSPMMLGFMNGAAVVIIASQLGKLCGIRLEEENTLQRLLEWAGRLRETRCSMCSSYVIRLALAGVSRREALYLAAGAFAGTLTFASPGAAADRPGEKRALAADNVLDLTHVLSPTFPIYPGPMNFPSRS